MRYYTHTATATIAVKKMSNKTQRYLFASVLNGELHNVVLYFKSIGIERDYFDEVLEANLMQAQSYLTDAPIDIAIAPNRRTEIIMQMIQDIRNLKD